MLIIAQLDVCRGGTLPKPLHRRFHECPLAACTPCAEPRSSAWSVSQVERLQRKFTTIHSTLAQQTSGTPKVDSEPSLRAGQAADQEQSAKV